jgi:hypothetical protein
MAVGDPADYATPFNLQQLALISQTSGGRSVGIGLGLTVSVVWWSEFPATDPEVRVRFPALSDFLRISESETGSTQPCEYN